VINDSRVRLLPCLLLLCLVWSLCGPSWGAHAETTGNNDRKGPTLCEMRLQKLPASILSLDFAARSDLAATALSNRQILVWSLHSGEVIHELTFPEPETDPRQKLESDVEPIRVRFAPDGKTLGISFLSCIHLFSVATWEETSCLGLQGEDAIRPRPKPQLARRPPSESEGAGVSGPTLNELAKDWARLKMQGDGRTRITDFRFTQDSSVVLASYCKGGCYDSKGRARLGAFPSGRDPVRLWNVYTGGLVWERAYDPEFVVEQLEVSGDGRLFAAVEHHPGECRIEVHDLKTGETLYSLPQINFAYGVPPLVFTPDGDYLITLRSEKGSPKHRPRWALAKYEARSGKRVAEFSGRYSVRHADLSPDGRWLVTSWNGIRFQIWNAQTRRVVAMKTPKKWLWSGPLIETVRFSPDGRWLVVASDASGKVAVYQLRP
jgi:WD40 repeat protein